MRTGYPEDAQMEEEMRRDPAMARHRHPAENMGMGESILGMTSNARGSTSMENSLSDLRNAIDKADHVAHQSGILLEKIRGPQPEQVDNNKVAGEPNCLLEELNIIGRRLDDALNLCSRNIAELQELI